MLETSEAPASLAIVNARVWTNDPRRPWAEAVLVRDGRVLALGSTAELRKRAGAETRVVDAGRRMVVSSKPGGRINRGDPADLVLVDDLVSLVPLPELDEQSIILELSSGRVVRDRDSSPT